jgi:hypothetical protein
MARIVRKMLIFGQGVTIARTSATANTNAC